MIAPAHLSVHAVMQADLRAACYHEYAHAVVARHLGAAAYVVEIRRNEEADLATEVAWTGKCAFHGRVPRRVCRVVALAGIAAEWLLDDPNPDHEYVFDCLRRGWKELSATDAAMAGNYLEWDVQQAFRRVCQLWDVITLESELRYTMENELLTQAERGES